MKLSSISMFRPAFKGVEYVKNQFGDIYYHFNYPYNSGDVDEKAKAKNEKKEFEGYQQKCTLKIFKMTPDGKSIVSELLTKDVPPEGVSINFKEYDVKPSDKVAYTFEITDNYGKRECGSDVGRNYYMDNDRYSVLALDTLKPTVNGSGYLLMPDSFAPGYVYKGFREENPDDISKIELNKELRDKAEKSPRTFSNMYGGGLAGMTAKIPYLKERGIKIVFGTPITGGDTVSAFKYWPENLFQIAGGIGEMHNYEDYMAELYKNGMVFVMDAPLTSEGLGGIHHQYALKWGDTDNQMKHWFRMENIENDQIGYGIVGKYSEGLRHYIVNAPNKFTVKDGQISYSEINENYDPKKPTWIQYYDKDYVSRELVDKKQLLDKYDKMATKNPLQTATHDETVVNSHYVMTKADYNAYLKNIDTLNEMNKNPKTAMDINSKEGTVYLSNFPRTKLFEKKETGELSWDANTDMIKLRYFDSAYDYKSKETVPVDAAGYTPANNEIQDMAVKYGEYWTKKSLDIQNIYTAQTLGNIGNADEAKATIEELIKDKKLPEEAGLSLEVLQNIDLDLYNLEIPEITAETLITKTIMNLPLESLTFSKDTLGVLSTSYFTPHAALHSQVGMSRYELEQQDNPQFIEYLNERYGYKDVYEKMNKMFKGEIFDFTRQVLERADESLPDDKKIFADSSKNILTPYGYYVTKYFAEDAARYILTKAIVSDTPAKINSKGQIIYDHDYLRENSSLEHIGVNGHTPKYEAELLAKQIKAGLKAYSTDSDEINFVKNALLKRFENVNLNAFKYAEAMVNNANLGLQWRIDALKDVEDIDSCLNQNEVREKVHNNLVSFWRSFADGVAKYNPGTCIYDEITDIDKIKVDGKDFGAHFMQDSNHTTEAAYGYFFTDVMKIFTGESAKAALEGGYFGGSSYSGFRDSQNAINNQLKELFTKPYYLDYMRHLYTFGGNHDKPRLAYCMMIDQRLVHADINNLPDSDGNRIAALLMITGATDMKDMPYDYVYNKDYRNYINENYLMGASNTAIANGKAIRDRLNEVLSGDLSGAEISKLYNAVTALVNGNFTIEPEKRASFNDYKTAMAEVLDIARNNGLNLHLGENDLSGLIDNLQKKSKEIGIWEASQGKLSQYSEFYTDSDVPHKILVLANILRKTVEFKLDDIAKYSTQNRDDVLNRLNSAIKTYMHKYTAQDVQDDLDKHLVYQLTRNDNERNAFGGEDIREAIRLVFAKAGLEEKTEAQFKLFKALNDPAVAKVKMYMRILASLPGVPTLYAGDELAMGGAEKKAKNIDLKNRNALLFSMLEGDSEEAKYYNKLNEEFKEISNIRANEDMAPLNNGTPYYIAPQYYGDVVLPSMFTMDKNGSAVVSLFNVAGISPTDRVNMPKTNYVELDSIKLNSTWYDDGDSKNSVKPLGIAGLSLATGMVFKNLISSDNTIYKVVKEGADYCIKRFDGKNPIKIVLSNGTMKDCVFTLYHNAKKLHFKGGNRREYYNPQFNIVSNPYHYLNENNKCGEKLSVISK